MSSNSNSKVSDKDWDYVQSRISEFGTPIFPFELCDMRGLLGTGAAMNVYEGTSISLYLPAPLEIAITLILLLGCCTINGQATNVAFKEHRRLNQRNLRMKDLEDIVGEFRHEITLVNRLNGHANVV